MSNESSRPSLFHFTCFLIPCHCHKVQRECFPSIYWQLYMTPMPTLLNLHLHSTFDIQLQGALCFLSSFKMRDESMSPMLRLEVTVTARNDNGITVKRYSRTLSCCKQATTSLWGNYSDTFSAAAELRARESFFENILSVVRPGNKCKMCHWLCYFIYYNLFSKVVIRVKI
jgi:hypothetical protein